MLKINKLLIHNINNLRDFEIKFNDGINIICGQNGAGKTSILNCILGSFRRRKLGSLNIHANGTYGFWEIVYLNNYQSQFRVHYIDREEDIKDTPHIKGNKLINTKYIISFPINNRNLNSNHNLSFSSLKRWMYKNYFKSDLNYSKESNFKMTRDCFSMIDSNISFSRIEEQSDKYMIKNSYYANDKYDIYVNTPKGEILIDHMSSGYQSTLIILLNLIKKVESLDSLGITVHTYEGIVLIDEIDLYLHPEWQKKLLEIIRWLLPNAQIIATTHSPHIIQSALPGEIIPLGTDMNGDTYIRDLPDSSQFGYQGWTIEEILTDVMGLKETRSLEYKKAIRNFDIAVDNEDRQRALLEYNKLENMLHPNNHALKLLKLQLTSLGGFENDKNQ